MTLTLQSLLDGVAELPLKVADDDLLVTYRPGKLTWAVRQKLFVGVLAFAAGEKPAAEETEAAWQAYCAALAGVLVAWDVVDEKGKPLAITAELLTRFPLDFVVSLGREVAKDSLVNPRIRVTLPNTSPTAAS